MIYKKLVVIKVRISAEGVWQTEWFEDIKNLWSHRGKRNCAEQLRSEKKWRMWDLAIATLKGWAEEEDPRSRLGGLTEGRKRVMSLRQSPEHFRRWWLVHRVKGTPLIVKTTQMPPQDVNNVTRFTNGVV